MIIMFALKVVQKKTLQVYWRTGKFLAFVCVALFTKLTKSSMFATKLSLYKLFEMNIVIESITQSNLKLA